LNHKLIKKEGKLMPRRLREQDARWALKVKKTSKGGEGGDESVTYSIVKRQLSKGRGGGGEKRQKTPKDLSACSKSIHKKGGKKNIKNL